MCIRDSLAYFKHNRIHPNHHINPVSYTHLDVYKRQIQDDTERISFNTAVSSFMICVNELTELKCNKRAILSELVILISPYAPHIAEELWQLLGNKDNVCNAAFPEYNEAFLLYTSRCV